jgi:putative endonuclease
MAVAQTVGENGENQAAAFLEFKGFEIIHRNWRAGRLEIDIIVRDGNKLVFIEVKSRFEKQGILHPEDMVNTLKRGRLITAAQRFMEKYPHNGPIRFDVISVITTTHSKRLFYHPDAFFPMGD